MRAAFAVLLALLAGFLPAAVAAAPALELDIDLDPASRRFQAVATVTLPRGDFRFVLHPSLAVTAASAGGRSLRVLAAGTHGALRAWRIEMPAPPGPLRLEYGGTLPALDPALDHRDVLQGLPPMAAKEGSFLPAGGAWYPQPAASLFSYRVSLKLPAGQRALVPGRLLSEESGVQGYRASFAFDRPADGIDLMAGPWTVREKVIARPGSSPLRLRTYFTTELDALPGLADAYLEDSQRYLERYEAEIGAYPFSEFSVVASPLPTGFGMPTLTYLGAQVLKLPFIRGTSLGHEVLHNWWGNGVHVDYERGNWSEGLTTFMADYAYKEDESAAAAREMRLGWLRDFAAVPEASQQPLVAFRSRTHGAAAAVGYGKSAMLFVMLRDTLGEAAFRRGLRHFWEGQRFRAAGWDDLRRAFEKAADRPLGVFFEQWLQRPGGAQARIAGATVRRQGQGMKLTLAIEQAAPAYALRLPVEIVYESGSEIRWVEITRTSERVALEVGQPPLGVRLDPDLRIWRRLEKEEMPPILRQWIVALAPRLLPASGGEAAKAAEALAGRLFEAAAQRIGSEALGQGSEPILIAGLHADVDALLARSGLPARPASLAGRGSAQAWTVQRPAGPPIAVISARDAESLNALQRPLPHYGAQSWLAFEGSRAIERGVWPAPGPLVTVTAGDP